MKPWKMSRRCLAPILILALVLAAQAVVGENLLLLKVSPASPRVVDAVAAAGGRVVQELNTCLLVRAKAADLPRLRGAGLACEAVGDPDSDASYFLMHSPLRAPVRGTGSGLVHLRLEEGVWLLVVRDPDFRSRLVQPFRLKALWLDVALPAAARQPAPSRERALRPLQDSDIAPLVAAVSSDRLRADIQSLQDFKTRFASTAECEAAGDFLLRRFQELAGVQAYADPFVFESHYASRNIVAVIPGQTDPGQVVLACAHYDSTSSNRYVAAPGADDNASGTAAILELTRILAGAKFDFTITLLCVSAEEWGLYGSAHYARQARAQGADIIAVVNLDMIAFPGTVKRELDVIGNYNSTWLADRFIAAAAPHVGIRLDKVINSSLTWSDHSSFWDQGYPALCGIEDSINPYYHRTNDTLDKLDLGFALDATRGALAAVADLAQPLSTPAPPSSLRAHSQVSFSLFLSRKTVYLDWHAAAGTIAGYHVYRATEPHGAYARLTGQPIAARAFTDFFLLPDQAYYYVVTAVDSEGRESNYSQEVRDDQDN